MDTTQGLLVLCTHNSARSILAEAMLNHWAARLGRPVRGHSAGSAPSGRVNPMALQVLQAAGVATDGLRSKSWSAFSEPGAPALAAVITVCDNAASEACPHFPGAPVQVHWGYPDPSQAAPEQQAQAFELTRQAIGYRMRQLLDLPWGAMTDAELRTALAAIGAS